MNPQDLDRMANGMPTLDEAFDQLIATTERLHFEWYRADLIEFLTLRERLREKYSQ